jgi:2-dehydro-3-deoxygluconokinase
MTARGLAAVGECMLELSASGDGLWRMGFAGDTFNTIWALRALCPQRACDYVSAFGDDPFSAQQIAFFKKFEVGIAASPVIAGARPGLYAITLDGAERSFTYWRSDSAARKLASDPAALARSLKERDLVYFSGITLAILDATSRAALIEAIGVARASGALIAFDPNYRPRLWNSAEDARASITEALAVADLALPTYPDEQMLFGDKSPEETAARIGDTGVKEIVVKDGARDAFWSRSGQSGCAKAVAVASPLDTTGAGDGFNGGYLAARLAGEEPAQAALRAHQVAAAVVQVRGALAPFETLQAAFSQA